MAGLAAPAGAEGAGGLQPHRVDGVAPDALARAGFDLREAPPTAGGGRVLVLGPAQVARLRAAGARVRPLGRPGRPAPVARAAGRAALPAPTHGFDVFRPWDLRPAACPGPCARPNVPLRRWYRDVARRHPDVVREVVYGRSVLGRPLVAYRVTAGARRGRAGRRPVAMFQAAQHAREWISVEVVRRLFADVVARRRTPAVRRLLRTRELWFVPVANPDGYDLTFAGKATRLWRKNVRDVDGDGSIAPGDGVDLNRNWPTRWGFDDEGSSPLPQSEVHRGAGPASEPEVRSLGALQARLRPRVLLDVHSFGRLILFPQGFQVETPATDAPLLAALAGTDDRPAIRGFDPDVSGELYTTNGDATDDALTRFGTQALTVELSPGTGPPVGGTVEGPASYAPGGFVFQDDERDVQAEFARVRPFALDLARAAGRPDARGPDLVPTTFPRSHGASQVVEVNAKRSLGAVRAVWRVNGGPERSAALRTFRGGLRHGAPGTYYRRLRGRVTGVPAGARVTVRFVARRARSRPFSYRVASATGRPVLLVVAEDHTGTSPGPYPGPRHRAAYEQALTDAGVAFDVLDLDASGRAAPSPLGVLSHYRAVVWETGDDVLVREPGQGDGTGVSGLLDAEVLALRDFLNEGGRVLMAGRDALDGAWRELLYDPRPGGAPCPADASRGGGDADDPADQRENCVAVSNDVLQYWFGAADTAPLARTPADASALALSAAGATFGLNGPDSAANHDRVRGFAPQPLPAFAGTPVVAVPGAPLAAGVATGATVLWGFGLEGVTGRATRAALVRDALVRLGVSR